MNKRVYKIGLFLSIILLLGVIVYLLVGFVNERNTRRFYEDLANMARQEEPVVAPEPEEEPAEEAVLEESEPEPVVIPIDFASLQAMNSDIYAWIYIPGSNINYPILQSPELNQEFYLSFTAERQHSALGAIFTQNYNNQEFTDPVTMIYGHHIRTDGPKFSQVHSYWNPEFFEAHRDLIIYLPDRILHYRVFAVSVFDDRHIMYAYDFDEAGQFREFLTDLHEFRTLQRHWADDISVEDDDKIVVLSTCTVDGRQRVLLGAVLVYEET